MGQRGVTLVEFLTTLAVGSILLGIGLPGFGYFMNGVRLSALANDMVASLNLARSEAIKRGVRVTVCKSSMPFAENPACHASGSWQQGWLVFVDRGASGILDGEDQLLRVQEGVEQARITANNFSAFVSYMPSGVSRGPNNLPTGSLSICLAGKQRRIILNSTGRIRLRNETC